MIEIKIGQKIGLWEILDFAGRTKYRPYYKCRCFCGTEKTLPYHQFTTSLCCGCRKKPLFPAGTCIGNLKLTGDYVYVEDHYEWLCNCDCCGKLKYIREDYLRRKTKGKKCCGASECKGATHVGSKIGKLKLLEKKKGTWTCLCDCGQIIDMNKDTALKRKNCGCVKLAMLKKKYLGLEIGRIKVVDFSHKNNHQNYWLCSCNCGNYTILSTAKIGVTQSCGCLWKDTITKHGLHGKPGYSSFLRADPLRRLHHMISVRVRDSLKYKGAKKIGRVFDFLPYTPNDLRLHLESLWEPWMNWSNYGGLMNDQRMTWHIDHIVPVSKFNFQSMEEQAFLDCWSLSNLRPLEKITNLRKWAN